MTRFDYPDPGTDPEYCNPLSPEPDELEDAMNEHPLESVRGHLTAAINALSDLQAGADKFDADVDRWTTQIETLAVELDKAVRHDERLQQMDRGDL